jgi:glycosyltransferase involved in cell wall biosynthesis
MNMRNTEHTSLSEENPMGDVRSATDLSIVMPAFNEENGIGKTLTEITETLSGLPIDFEIIVVDDGSSDGTKAAAEKSGARVISNDENRGYGYSLKRGIMAGNSTYVAIIDADGTYPASAIPKMLEIARTSDMVVAARGSSMTNVPLIRRPAKFILNHFANFLAQRKIPDLNSGLRVIRRTSLTRFLFLLPNGFSFTTTITLCMICSELSVKYIPIDYRRRIGKSSMKATDFFNFLLLVLRAIVLFNPLRVFLPVGALLFVLGAVKFAYDLVWVKNLSEGALLGILGAIMIWTFGLLADMISRLNLRR